MPAEVQMYLPFVAEDPAHLRELVRREMATQVIRDLPRLIEKEVKSHVRILREKLDEEIAWTTAEIYASIYDSIGDVFPDPEAEPKDATTWLVPSDKAPLSITDIEC